MTISAKVIADSIGEDAPRLTTIQLRYPKLIHGEFMTHRVFSRNASSSRAIPVERLIKDVIEDPVYPSHWGANQKGMQADEECDARVVVSEDYWWGDEDPTRKEAWDVARDTAVSIAKSFTDAGYHKQIVNRLLEPFCHINVVVTATEWSNFFALRCHPGAQPEMRMLAEAIFDAMNGDKPPRLLGPTDWHLPYVDIAQGGWSDPDDDRPIKVSVARCARVSYLTQDGKTPTVEEDLKLYDRLAGSVPIHASPMEHQATPDKNVHNEFATPKWGRPDLHGNLRGWIQYRKTLTGECQ